MIDSLQLNTKRSVVAGLLTKTLLRNTPPDNSYLENRHTIYFSLNTPERFPAFSTSYFLPAAESVNANGSDRRAVVRSLTAESL